MLLSLDNKSRFVKLSKKMRKNHNIGLMNFSTLSDVLVFVIFFYLSSP